MLLMQRARRVSGLALLATISDQLFAALQNPQTLFRDETLTAPAASAPARPSDVVCRA
jgi:hypothetical protein